MVRKAEFSQKLRYAVDNYLARGSSALFLGLLIVLLSSMGLLVVMRLIFHLIAPPENADFFSHLWTVWLELTDPGAMGEDTETPGIFKVAAVMSGLTGVVIFSSLVAFLGAALEGLIEGLKRGDTTVLETEHTLILGWGPRVVEILRELVIANESESNPCVVILSEEPKEEMDQYLRDQFPERASTKIVTRSGSTSSLLMLDKVSASSAKAAIVLATEDGTTSEKKSASDAKVIKTVLALMTHVPADHEINIVAEVYDERNRVVVKEIDPNRIFVIDAQEILAKIMVQTSRTTGLAVVYSEMLGFAGSEMYFHNNPKWAGLTFGQLGFHFPDGVIFGLRHGGTKIEIRPAPTYAMKADDEILIIADDDSTIHFKPQPVIVPQDLPLKQARIAPRAERQLVLGWSPKAPIILGEYADYVLTGSVIDVMVKDPTDEVLADIARLNEELETIQISHVDESPLDVEALERIKPFGYNNVIILPQSLAGDLDPDRIDSETLIVLLHLRKLQAKLRAQGYTRFGTKIITEVLDSNNQELITKAGVDDFIISNRMVSMFLAQISEQPGIQSVYDDLFQEEGSEIYLKPAWLYLDKLPMTLRFADLMALAQKRDGEVCIGYKIKALEDDSEENFGVKLNPPKDRQITLNPEDALVVVAEDDR
jgi:Trk K+ transport system NAD-binding subunit